MCYPTEADLANTAEGKQHIIRIPIRTRGGEPLSFGPKDIILEDGDIVMVQARQPQFFYTGGLLPSSEIPLPRRL